MLSAAQAPDFGIASNVIDPARFLEVSLREATEHSVQLVVRNVPHGSRDPSPIVGFSGTVYGPVLQRSQGRTLPTRYPLTSNGGAAGERLSAVATIPDPCYWSPDSPLHYILQLELQWADGKSEWPRPTGFRRLEAHGRSLYINGTRSVLRGSVVGAIDEAQMRTAQNSRSTLLIREASWSWLRDANGLGVNMIVDLRGVSGDLTEHLVELTWHPSVVVVILDDQSEAQYKPERLLYCQAINAGRSSPEIVAAWANLLAFELDLTERLPDWGASSGKPMIAIRRGRPYADIRHARQVADLMQAELAPEHDLAGYIAADCEALEDEPSEQTL
jgi:hypothetical protein